MDNNIKPYEERFTELDSACQSFGHPEQKRFVDKPLDGDGGIIPLGTRRSVPPTDPNNILQHATAIYRHLSYYYAQKDRIDHDLPQISSGLSMELLFNSRQ